MLIDYIERYAWFPFDGSNTEKFGNGTSGLFFCGENDPQKGELTSLGKAYQKSGNPKGYTKGATYEDVVLPDEGELETVTVEETTVEVTTEEATTVAETTTEEEITTVEEETTVEEVTKEQENQITVSNDVAVLGYQVSSTVKDSRNKVGGIRVIASAEPQINGKRVDSYGLVYYLK